MKVFRIHEPLLMFIYMCEDKSANFFQNIFSLAMNILQRTLLVNIFITSALYSYEKIKLGNIEEALYGMFQVNAASFGLFIITTVTYNRKKIRIMIDKAQKIVNHCKQKIKSTIFRGEFYN